MKQRYRITPEGGERLSDADIAKHRDTKRLLYNYQRAAAQLHRKPLYKDKRAFIALLIIVLLSIFIAEVVEEERKGAPAQQERP